MEHPALVKGSFRALSIVQLGKTTEARHLARVVDLSGPPKRALVFFQSGGDGGG